MSQLLRVLNTHCCLKEMLCSSGCLIDFELVVFDPIILMVLDMESV